jgi:soluble lytic murein transglycosylase-like protein
MEWWSERVARRDGGAPIRALAIACAQITLALALAGPASAQVIELTPGGPAAVYSGPVVSSSEGRQAISPKTSTQAPAGARNAKAAPSAGRYAEVLASIDAAADRRQLSARLVEAVAWQESRLRQQAVSRKGALGVMQLTPATAAHLGVDARDARQNVEGGAAYLSRLLEQFDGDIELTLAAYNAGPEAVRRWGGVPPYPETRAYVAAILEHMAEMATPAPRPTEAR